MTKPLPTSDFRVIRIVCEPSDYAFGPSSEPPICDLVNDVTWHGIMDLPDDVSIRTSNYQGEKIERIYELWIAWMEVIGDVQDSLSESMIDAADEFQAIIFNSLHGFYRQAIGSLRNALEIVTIGAYCQVLAKSNKFAKWRSGQIEISFGEACDNLIGAPSILPLNLHLDSVSGDSIFRQRTKTDVGGWARRLYSELSNYLHSRPNFTNADLWKSNGPIYEPNAFEQTLELLFQTYALCYILVKVCRPKFGLPKHCMPLFQSKGASWQKVAHHSYNYLFQQREE